MSILAPSPYPPQEPGGVNHFVDVAPPLGNVKPHAIRPYTVEGTLRDLLRDHVEAAKLFICEPAEVWHPLRYISFLESLHSPLLDMSATLTWVQNRRPGDDFGRIVVFDHQGNVANSFRITL